MLEQRIDACLAELGETIVYIISNYPNGCADIHCGVGFERVSGGQRGEKDCAGQGSAESSIWVSEWWLVNEALQFQTESRLRWLQRALLPPHGVSQVTPVRSAGTSALPSICNTLLLLFFLTILQCSFWTSRIYSFYYLASWAVLVS